MDVTHIPKFGCLSFLHVTIDTFSSFIWATPLAGEHTNHVIQHLLKVFSIMGVPSLIKTDNGPAYTSKKLLGSVNGITLLMLQVLNIIHNDKLLLNMPIIL